MSCQVGGVQDVFRGTHTITRTPDDVRGLFDFQVRSQSAHRVDQRSSTINAPQRCVSSVRSQADADPFRLATLRCNHTVAACSRLERESTSTATQPKNCESLNWGQPVMRTPRVA